ncbi:MAG: 5-dehydro-2-deoxygluconokinase [Pseudomonadota bacterium]
MDLLKGIAKNKFLVVGRAGMDFFADPPGTATEHAEVFHAGLGGSSANIAAGICKLGGAASLVTRVSDDSVGRYCVNQLRKYGVETRWVTPVAGEFRNSLAVYESRVANHQSVIYRNGAADFQMNKDDVAAVDYAAHGALITAGTVFAAEPSREATFHAFKYAKEKGNLPIIFDVDYRPYSWVSAQDASDTLSAAADLSDLIVGNDEEFGFMAGSYDGGLDKARSLAAQGKTIIYKMGEKGAITFAEGEEIRTGIYAVDALKPTGAGDSFMAGLMTALAEGKPWRDAIMTGSACAAIVVGKPGCAPAMPYPDELAAFMAAHEPQEI